MGIGVKYRVIGREAVCGTKRRPRSEWYRPGIGQIAERGKNRQPYDRWVMTVAETNKRYPKDVVVEMRRLNGVGRQPNRLRAPRVAGYIL